MWDANWAKSRGGKDILHCKRKMKVSTGNPQRSTASYVVQLSCGSSLSTPRTILLCVPLLWSTASENIVAWLKVLCSDTFLNLSMCVIAIRRVLTTKLCERFSCSDGRKNWNYGHRLLRGINWFQYPYNSLRKWMRSSTLRRKVLLRALHSTFHLNAIIRRTCHLVICLFLLLPMFSVGIPHCNIMHPPHIFKSSCFLLPRHCAQKVNVKSNSSSSSVNLADFSSTMSSKSHSGNTSWGSISILLSFTATVKGTLSSLVSSSLLAPYCSKHLIRWYDFDGSPRLSMAFRHDSYFPLVTLPVLQLWATYEKLVILECQSKSHP